MSERELWLRWALNEALTRIDSLRDFVSEGGSRNMVGAVQAIREADDFANYVHSELEARTKETA